MRKRTPRVLLLIESSREFGRALLAGIAEYARFHGPWSIYTYPPFFRDPAGNRRLLTRMKRTGIDGIIAREMSEITVIRRMRIPAIFASTIEPEKGVPRHSFPVITTDNARVSELAAEHLLEGGYVNFAYCGYDEIPWSQLRGQYFAKVVATRGSQTHFYRQPRTSAGLRWENEILVLAEWLRDLPKPVGLMTCCDDRSRNVVEAAKLAGVRIPEDVAVVGVDNDELICHLANPSLSSVALATERAGSEAARLLDAFMTGRTKMAGQKILIQPTHVEARHSTDMLAVEDMEVVEAMRFIREHIREQIQVDTVADATCLSRRSLERRFHATIGRSIQSEINALRAEQITKMLIQTHLSPVEIAQAMGFTSSDNMRRFFKRQIGMTPRAYRKHLGRG